MFCFRYSETITKLLGIKSIPVDEVIQQPKLLNDLLIGWSNNQYFMQKISQTKSSISGI
jgi:hypothetical protein